MRTLVNDNVLQQLKRLHNAAIELKEKMDQGKDIEIIRLCYSTYSAEYTSLNNLIPEILKNTFLQKHTAWTGLWLKKGKAWQCEKDVKEICIKDIFEIEKKYIEVVNTENKDFFLKLFS